MINHRVFNGLIIGILFSLPGYASDASWDKKMQVSANLKTAPSPFLTSLDLALKGAN